MKKDEIREGLLNGFRLCQEEWASDADKNAVDELVAEGVAYATPWEYSDNFQCERRYVTRRKETDGEKENQLV